MWINKIKITLSEEFWRWIVGGLVALVLSSALIARSVCSSSNVDVHLVVFICDAKITDLALVYFTYCLVIVGWFGIRSSQEAAETVERAYLWPGYGLMINDREGVRIGVHLGVRNTGRTVGILKTVHIALVTIEDDKDPKKVIPYEVYGDREDPVIPNPNTESRSGVWHRLAEMPKVSRGWITYHDIFGKEHRRSFRYVVHASGRTDPLPDCFEYEPWNSEYMKMPSKQERLPLNVVTVEIKTSEAA